MKNVKTAGKEAAKKDSDDSFGSDKSADEDDNGSFESEEYWDGKFISLRSNSEKSLPWHSLLIVLHFISFLSTNYI